MAATVRTHTKTYFRTPLGRMILGDSLEFLRDQEDKSVDLIVTSPPFALVRKKEYGNVDASEYTEWFRPFAEEFKRVLKDSGSFVLDIGGAWNRGQATRHLYQFKLLIMLNEEYGFHLAQEFYWWNPSKLPTPAEWVTVRRIRVKDAVNCVWWLSPTPWPKASNRRVLQPYSDSMQSMLKSGFKAMKRPSGHAISEKFNVDNGAAIPPNLLAIPNTESNSYYLRYCKQNGLRAHPARYPAGLPEFFIKMLTDKGDLVVDPFAGSCVTGEVCEHLERRWVCVELMKEYLEGALSRFHKSKEKICPQEDLFSDIQGSDPRQQAFYRIPRPGMLQNGDAEERLPEDGGATRSVAKKMNDSRIWQYG